MDESQPPAPPSFPVNYIKTNDYREVCCEGAIGGPTPAGKLFMALYSERMAIPRVAVFAADPPSKEGGPVLVHEDRPPLFTEGREGLIRNIEFGIYLDIATAKKLQSWLGAKIVEVQSLEENRGL